MNSHFAAMIYEDAKRLFPDGTVETLTKRPGSVGGEPDTAVRLIHTPTGITITSLEAFLRNSLACIVAGVDYSCPGYLAESISEGMIP